MTVTELLLAALPVFISGFAYLLKRSIDDMTAKLDKLDTKVDCLSGADAAHDSKLVELGVRVSHLEAGQASAQAWRDDITGFLQGAGFVKRERP